VSNLPKVVTQRHLEQDLNSRPVDCKPKCLTRCTTAPPHFWLASLLSQVRCDLYSKNYQWPAILLAEAVRMDINITAISRVK